VGSTPGAEANLCCDKPHWYLCNLSFSPIRDSEKALEEYEKFISKDPKKCAKEIATLKQLRDSDVNYIVVLGGKFSEVMIYVGHGAGDRTNSRFQQQGLVIDSILYTAAGQQVLIQNEQSGYLLPKPEVTAQVMVNFSCDSSGQGANYFNFTGKGQLMVTLNGGKDGVTNAGTIEKAASIFVRVYASTQGTYLERTRAAAAAAQKFIEESAKTIRRILVMVS
jgi:hypothetical protein